MASDGHVYRTGLRIAAALLLSLGGLAVARADAPPESRQEKCKAAMNARIQACTDVCTARALAAASNYVDTNNNVKFGCLKGCAVGQILQMRACVNGADPNVSDPTETNR